MRFVQLKLVGPIIGVLILLIAAMASFPYFGVMRIDAEARQREETLVRRNIALWTKDIEFSLTAWTIWDDAIAKIDNAFDFDWVDRNIGASLIGTSRTRFVAIIDADDGTIYSRMDDAIKANGFFVRGADAIVDSASALVAEVRLRERAPAAPGIPSALVVSRMQVLGEDAVLLSASLFQPDFGTAKPRNARGPILITAMPITGTLQDFFGTRFLLDDAAISPLSEVSDDRARAEIAVGADGEIQVLSWHAPTPAANALRQSLPLAVTIGAVLLAAGLFTLGISRTTARKLMLREREMRHAASHDFLTGLANRSMLQPRYGALVERGPVSVVCIDLDGFKGVNDAYGHAVGDELLKAVAERLRAGVRENDRLFRLGGDEFAIMMPGLPLKEAEKICRRLALTLAQPIALSGGEVLIGASFGIRQVENRQTTCDDALKSADTALYRAKAGGRGEVVVSLESDNDAAKHALSDAA